MIVTKSQWAASFAREAMNTRRTVDYRPHLRAPDGGPRLPLRESTSAARGTSALRRGAALCWLVACILPGIAGCGGRGGRDDPATTKAFSESFDRATKKISAICSKVSEQVASGGPLTPPQRAAFIIVYGRAAADVKLDDAPESLRACRDGVNDAFAKLRSATAEVIVKATAGNNHETIALANAAAPAVTDALRELTRAANGCRRDAQQLDPQPLTMLIPNFALTLSCL